jgi:hypothetical protein
MRGARVHATVPISQQLLDQMLGNLPLKVEIQEQNRFSISYGAVRVSADIVEVTPELTIVLSTSWLSRMAIRSSGVETQFAVLRGPEGQVRSPLVRPDSCRREISIWWRHLSQVEARTTRGRLVLDLDADVR